MNRRLSHGESKRIIQQGKLFKGISSASGTPRLNEDAMMRMTTLGLLARITEITNASGESQPHATEADLDVFDESEMTFLSAAIKALDDPIAPIRQEDRDDAEKAALRIEDYRSRGKPIRPEEEVNVETYAAQRAQEHLFRHDQRDLSESSRQAE